MRCHHLKLVLMLTVISLLSACNSAFTSAKKTPNEPITSATSKQVSQSTTWQKAYGEPLETTSNTLPNRPENSPADAEPIMTASPITDVWQRIRNGYGISHNQLHDDSKQQLQWFINHPDYIDRVVERARPYLYYIVEEIERRKMPLEIALLPVVESGFQPFAYSHGRASGLWQFIPGTGKLYGLEQNWWYDGRRDVIASTHAALNYLEKLHNDFGDWQLALAAYNCGEGTVGRAIKHNQKLGKATDFWSLDLPRETSAYVPKLMAIAHLVKQPEQYGITLNPINNAPYLTEVDIGSQIDLALAAQLAEITPDELQQLNPGFNQWATKPNGPHNLVVPIEKVAIFKRALASLPTNQRVQWTRHKIKSGESLGLIASRYNSTIAVIKEANGLTNNLIRANTYLLIPKASKQTTNYASSSPLPQSSKKEGDKKVHTVIAGDTWWDLANTYQVDVNTLTTWNSKAPDDILQPGQKLVVWENDQLTLSSNKIKSITYRIRSGDSLWKISQKFKVSMSQVLEWNGLSEKTPLQPGQHLTLYVDVTQQHGSI